VEGNWIRLLFGVRKITRRGYVLGCVYVCTQLEMSLCLAANSAPVNKIFLEQPSPEPKVMIPMYEPLETSKCEKCGKVIAEPKELIRVKKRSFLLKIINAS